VELRFVDRQPRPPQLGIEGRVGSLLASLGDMTGPHLQHERPDRVALALIKMNDVGLANMRGQKAISQVLSGEADGLQINANVSGIRDRRLDRHRRHAM
jgi:hypothetical protein